MKKGSPLFSVKIMQKLQIMYERKKSSWLSLESLLGVRKYFSKLILWPWGQMWVNLWVNAVQNMGDSFDRQMTRCVPKGGLSRERLAVLLTNKMFYNVANSIQWPRGGGSFDKQDAKCSNTSQWPQYFYFVFSPVETFCSMFNFRRCCHHLNIRVEWKT